MMRVVLATVLCVLCSGLLAATDLIPDCASVPGWETREEVREFVPDTLFDYMNGNSEGYFLYGFKKMVGVTCGKGDNSILIDVFEMGSPELAWGIFTANRHPRFDTAKIGTAGQIMPSKATFAKGKYYVELAANGERDQQTTLSAYIKLIEPLVPGPEDLPKEIAWFPKEELAEGEVRLVPQSVLGLRMLERGYLARYSYGRAFVVSEESDEAAAQVMTEFRERLADVADADIADEGITGRDRYLRQMCVARKGNYIVGYAGLKETDGKAETAALAASIP